MKTKLSNTKLKIRLARKTNPSTTETIKMAKENSAWAHVAKVLSGSTRLYSSVNLSKIDEQTKEGDTVLIIGKVLSSGNLSKKVRIVSLSISESAKEKMKATKSEYATIMEEIKINPKYTGVKLIQ